MWGPNATFLSLRHQWCQRLKKVVLGYHVYDTVYVYSLQYLKNGAFIDGTFDIYWNRLIQRKKQMIFTSISFQVVETESFKHFFSVVISRLFMTSLGVGPHS